MDQESKIYTEYKEAFNLGYELARELDLKSPMFKDLNSESIRMSAMQAGMMEFSNETKKGMLKDIDGSSVLDNNHTMRNTQSKKDKGKGKGFDLSI